MAPHRHVVSHDLGTRLMAMSAARRLLWAAGAVLLLWLAVWWALSFEAAAAQAVPAPQRTEVAP